MCYRMLYTSRSLWTRVSRGLSFRRSDSMSELGCIYSKGDSRFACLGHGYMQWPWRQHTAGSGSQPRRTEIGSGTTGKCTACVVYTRKMYILNTMRTHTQRKKKKKCTRDTQNFRITVFGLLRNYRPCPKCQAPTSPQFGDQCPMMVWWSSQVLARWKCASPFAKWKSIMDFTDNLKDDKYTSVFVNWDWKQRLKFRIQSHLEKNGFVFPALSL